MGFDRRLFPELSTAKMQLPEPVASGSASRTRAQNEAEQAGPVAHADEARRASKRARVAAEPEAGFVLVTKD
jgi:hypothetical protein